MTEQEKLLKWLKKAELGEARVGVKTLEYSRDRVHQELSKTVGTLSHQGEPLRLPCAGEAELLP
ncbi:hypothetical protein Dxin01_00809 [Deinococcus xinjiangensis]|uniref:Uncharacterized protein n=1 Tax=Deinococcus xinjiangensis TaxID=457454 RepID=A0ABP9VAN8_9DEIO